MAEPSITAQRVFDIAMGLIDEVNESSGATDTADTKEYKVRSLLILNALQGELYQYSDTYEITEPNKRPVLFPLQSFGEVINLDDYICGTVLPYGLAAQLLLDENPSSASFFQQRYEELRNGMTKGFPTESEAITDVYGVGGYFEYNEFSRW